MPKVDRTKKQIKDWPRGLMDACQMANDLVEDEDKPHGLANHIAGKEYDFSASDVAWARGQLGHIKLGYRSP